MKLMVWIIANKKLSFIAIIFIIWLLSKLFAKTHLSIYHERSDIYGNLDAFHMGNPILVFRNSDSLKDCKLYPYKYSCDDDYRKSPLTEQYFLDFDCIPRKQNIKNFTFSYAVLPNSTTHWIGGSYEDNKGRINNYYGRVNNCDNDCIYYDIDGNIYKDFSEWEAAGLRNIQKVAAQLPENAWKQHTISIKEIKNQLDEPIGQKDGLVIFPILHIPNIFDNNTILTIDISRHTHQCNNPECIPLIYEQQFYTRNLYYWKNQSPNYWK